MHIFAVMLSKDLHCCLGHISPAAAMQLVDRQILVGATVNDRNVEFCEVCALGLLMNPFAWAKPAKPSLFYRV